MMTEVVTKECDQHHGGACPDRIIYYSLKFDEYGIQHADGSLYKIDYCPWCGTKLPASLRDKWFSELEAAGIDFWSDNIPAHYQTDEWHANA